MISKETAIEIFRCYDGLENCEKLLDELKAQIEKNRSLDPKELRDKFGFNRAMELGVPSGQGSTRIFGVKPALAVAVIEAHIEDSKNELKRLETICKIELMVPSKTIDHVA